MKADRHRAQAADLVVRRKRLAVQRRIDNLEHVRFVAGLRITMLREAAFGSSCVPDPEGNERLMRLAKVCEEEATGGAGLSGRAAESSTAAIVPATARLDRREVIGEMSVLARRMRSLSDGELRERGRTNRRERHWADEPEGEREDLATGARIGNWLILQAAMILEEGGCPSYARMLRRVMALGLVRRGDVPQNPEENGVFGNMLYIVKRVNSRLA